jgi:hypothetical protein
MNFEHTTQPADSGTMHHWSYGNERDSISLSVLFSRDSRTADLCAGMDMAWMFDRTDGGIWQFGGLLIHHYNPGSGWSCADHGDVCDMDSYSTEHSRGSWQRIAAGGVTDQAVHDELEFRWQDEFAEDGVR